MTVLRQGCDSYSHANPATLTALGLAFAWQYLLGSPDKDLTAPVAQALLNGGKDIILNAENTATDADGGFNNGVANATRANQQADAIGAPYRNFDGSLVTIVYSVDSQRSTAQITPYVHGLASVTRGRTVGGYGGTEWKPLKQQGLCKVWGQANAGSWSGWGNPPGSNFPTDPLADFRQHLAVTARGYSYDPQDQMSASSQCGFWLAPRSINPPTPLPTPAPPPILQEDDMPTVVAVDIAINPANPAQGYTLDAKGGIHAFGGAPPMADATAPLGPTVNAAVTAAPPPYWPVTGPARRLVITDWTLPAGMVMDCLGGLHGFGGYEPGDGYAYWPDGFVPPPPN